MYVCIHCCLPSEKKNLSNGEGWLLIVTDAALKACSGLPGCPSWLSSCWRSLKRHHHKYLGRAPTITRFKLLENPVPLAIPYSCECGAEIVSLAKLQDVGIRACVMCQDNEHQRLRVGWRVLFEASAPSTNSGNDTLPIRSLISVHNMFRLQVILRWLFTRFQFVRGVFDFIEKEYWTCCHTTIMQSIIVPYGPSETLWKAYSTNKCIS